MNLPNFKQSAYLLLSDANMLSRKVVNPYQLVNQLSMDWTVGNIASNDSLGRITKKDNGITLEVFESGSQVSQNFAMATLVAFTMLNNPKEQIPEGYYLPLCSEEHENNTQAWNNARALASILLCYSFTPRELKKLQAEGLTLEKNISKIALARGIPTKYMVRRIALEMKVNSPV